MRTATRLRGDSPRDGEHFASEISGGAGGAVWRRTARANDPDGEAIAIEQRAADPERRRQRRRREQRGIVGVDRSEHARSRHARVPLYAGPRSAVMTKKGYGSRTNTCAGVSARGSPP